MASTAPKYFDVTASRGNAILNLGNPSQNPIIHSMFTQNEHLAIKFVLPTR